MFSSCKTFLRGHDVVAVRSNGAASNASIASHCFTEKYVSSQFTAAHCYGPKASYSVKYMMHT